MLGDRFLLVSRRLPSAVWFPLMGLLALVGAACTEAGDEQSEDDPAILAPDPEVDAESVPEGTAIEDLFTLQERQCFNRYELERDDPDLPTDLTTLVDCRRPHDAEVYEFLEHPAGPGVEYPGAEGMEDWARQACYEQFEAFVGVEYELSVLQIGSIRPPKENWDQGPYRGVHCYVFASDGQLSGSMAGSEL